jgi:hypothetical protein
MTERDESDLSPTLAETAKRRADLHQALVAVEQATSRPAVGREADWTKEVVVRLEDLSHAIAEHVEVTERPAGLYDEICGRAPHLSGKIDRLREEHPRMQEGTDELTAKLRSAGPGQDWSLEEARDDLQRLLGRMVRHRQLGSDLVWEAYNLDIGGIE